MGRYVFYRFQMCHVAQVVLSLSYSAEQLTATIPSTPVHYLSVDPSQSLPTPHASNELPLRNNNCTRSIYYKHHMTPHFSLSPYFSSNTRSTLRFPFQFPYPSTATCQISHHLYFLLLFVLSHSRSLALSSNYEEQNKLNNLTAWDFLSMMSSLVHTWHPLRAPAPAFRRRRIHHTRRFIFISRCALEERTVIESYKNLNGNGRGIKYEEVEREGKNGKLDVYLESDNGNGGLMKYEEVGNGVAGKSGNMQVEERERKKRIEDIGKEDAWFKTYGDQPQVSVAPGGRWSQFKTYSTIQRTLEIWGFVFAFIFRTWLNSQKFSYRGGMTEEKKANRRRVLAKWLKENILRLGPTFIKIGQQFSTRVDILPQEYVDQLSELQDQVPPFPSDTAVSIIEEELGAPIGNIFDRFDYEPIAAASLGQVHRASLNRQEVVIKVQRPGLKDLFDIDLKNLRVIAEYLQKVDPKSDGAKRDWVAIYDECAYVLYEEIDYTKEAANAEKFAENFKSMDYVKVPTIVWDYTTPQVLTMEYVPGIKINRIKQLDQLGLDRKRLGRYAVESYLEQILSHGFFHADPHPGNIAVDDVNGGRLIFYDFGMMGSISPNIREGLLEVFYGVYEKDPDKVIQAMVQMGVLVPTGDMTAVRRTAQFFLNSFEERLVTQMKERERATAELGFKQQPSKEERFEKKKQRLAAIGEDLLAIAADQPFRFPATFTFVVRAFSVLDGIGKGLDPRFDITEIAKPYAMELLRFREAGIEVAVKDLRKRWDRQSQAFYNLFRQADRVEKLAQIIQRLEQGDLKLRVRTLESERSFQRVATVQKTIGCGVAAGSLVNLATILYFNSVRVPAMTAYVVGAFCGLQVLIGLIKIKKLDQRERLITGTA